MVDVMFDVMLYLFLASFFLILLGTGIYIRFREKINEFPFKEKNNGLIMHIQKYRYWYLAVTVIVLAPILTYYWDSVFNPPRFKPPPELNVPSPVAMDNVGDVFIFFESSSTCFYFFKTFAPRVVFFVSLLLMPFGPRIFSKYDIVFQSSIGIISSIILLFTIAVIVTNILYFIFFIILGCI